ncbi:hypothetical protein [Geomonas sp.]|uniref:hypothetical protein n=1 Tax=Geomonas sp. TaxID=2651584 RepID=UPI002B458EE2|nr:hypothetical protein [Geomonas sp.]HJV36723.1 hypothetical protein [Geomonas sp.]
MDELHDPLRHLLFRLASRFRSGILRCNWRSLSLPTLRDFPRGACGDASLLLAKYLQVQRCGLAHYVLGGRAGLPHAWLQLHGFVVDITADQFDDQVAGVIVSADSSWHCSFHGKIHSPADFCLYDRETVFKLTHAYRQISSHLDS